MDPKRARQRGEFVRVIGSKLISEIDDADQAYELWRELLDLAAEAESRFDELAEAADAKRPVS